MDTSTPSPYEPAVFRLPLPADFEDEKFESIQERANAFCGAAERIVASAVSTNQPVCITEQERQHSIDVFSGNKPVGGLKTTAEYIHLTALLNAYDMSVVQSAQQLRNFCTNILIDKAGTGKTEQVQLRAVEMLGKIKDVALFEERSTILIEHMTTEDIQKGLREKINRMRSMTTQEVTDVTARTIPDAPSE